MFTNAEWLDFCAEHSIPAAPVADLAKLDDDPHFAAVGLLNVEEHPTEGAYRVIKDPVSFSSGSAASVHTHAPRIGEHTAEIMAALGWTPAQIADLN